MATAHTAPIAQVTKNASDALPKRIVELDGLRAIAVLGVIICHYVDQSFGDDPRFIFRLLTSGRHGVDLFFVLSGFLIGRILLSNRKAENFYKTFYMRRAFRILPIATLTSAVFAPFFWHYHLTNFPWHSYLTFSQNFYVALMAAPPVMFYLWSLAMEEQFYFLLPFVIRRWPLSIPRLALASFVLSPFVRLVEARITARAPLYLPFGRFDMLMAGVMIAYAVENRYELRRISRKLPIIIGALLAAEIALLAMGWDTTQLPHATVGITIDVLFFGAIVLDVLLNPSRWRWLREPQLVRIGTYSYCVYLIHQPLYAIGGLIAARLGLFVLHIAIGLLLTFTIAPLSWHFFEAPILNFANRYRYRTDPLQTAD